MHTFTSNQLFNSEPVTNYIKRILAESRSWATSVPLNFDFAPDKSFKGYAYQLFRVYKNKYKVHKPQIYFLDIERRFDENQSPQIVIYKVKYLGIKELFYLKPHSSNINNLNLRFTLVEDDYPRNTNEHPKISSGFINIYYDTECNDRESAKNKAIEFESSLKVIISDSLENLYESISRIPDLIKTETEDIIIERLKKEQDKHNNKF